MGEKDNRIKNYLSDNKRFADVFNYYMFNGQQVILPDELIEKDPEEVGVQFVKNGTAASTIKKLRDILKIGVIRYYNGSILSVLGIENNCFINYAIPAKEMVYDAFNYDTQLRDIRKAHTQARDLKEDEYLSGFAKDDRLMPVITLVVYFGSRHWDGARSLHEMFATNDESILKYVNDYKINLIEPTDINDISKFSTDIGCVLGFFNRTGNKEQMKEYLEQHKDIFSALEPDAAMVLNECADLKLQLMSEKGEVDMCKAWDDWHEEGRSFGLQEGRTAGLQEGIRIFVLDNIEEGKTAQEIVRKLMLRFGLSKEMAEKAVNC